MDLSKFMPALGFWRFQRAALRVSWVQMVASIFAVEAFIGVICLIDVIARHDETGNSQVWRYLVRHPLILLVLPLATSAWVFLTAGHRLHQQKCDTIAQEAQRRDLEASECDRRHEEESRALKMSLAERAQRIEQLEHALREGASPRDDRSPLVRQLDELLVEGERLMADNPGVSCDHSVALWQGAKLWLRSIIDTTAIDRPTASQLRQLFMSVDSESAMHPQVTGEAVSGGMILLRRARANELDPGLRERTTRSAKLLGLAQEVRLHVAPAAQLENTGQMDAATLAGKALVEAIEAGAFAGDEFAAFRSVVDVSINGEFSYQLSASPSPTIVKPPPTWHAFCNGSLWLLEHVRGKKYGGFGPDLLADGGVLIAELMETEAKRLDPAASVGIIPDRGPAKASQPTP